MYSETKEIFNDAVINLLTKETEYPDFIQHFKTLLQRRHEWVLFYRSTTLLKSRDCNNYAEVTMKVYKSVILNRLKNFSLISQVEFCILVLDKYLVEYLSNFAYGESSTSALLYSSLLKRTDHKLNIKFGNYNENVLVQSESKPQVYYVVNVNIGVCSCPIGNNGAFCKHQYALFEEKKLNLPNAPVITQADRYDLAVLALGDKCPLSYFLSTKDKMLENDSNIKICNVESLCDSVPATSCNAQPISKTSVSAISSYGQSISRTSVSTASKDQSISGTFSTSCRNGQLKLGTLSSCIKECKSEIKRIISILGDEIPKSSIKRLTNTLRKVQTKSDATLALQTATLALSAVLRAKAERRRRQYMMSHLSPHITSGR